MIDPKSLRIGNTVTIENPKYWPKLKGIPMTVTNIHTDPTDSISVVDANAQAYHQFSEYISGIPLSEQELIRLGFTRNAIAWHKDISDFPQKEFKQIAVSLNQGIMIRCGNLSDWREEDEVISIYNTDIQGPLTVHKLQNVFYEIKGTELTYKVENNEHPGKRDTANNDR